MVADLVGEEVTRKSMATLREDLEDLRARLDETEAGTVDLPHRRKYLLIAVGFLRSYIELHEELIAEVERELSP